VKLTGTNSSIGLIYALKKIFSIKKNTFYKILIFYLQRNRRSPLKNAGFFYAFNNLVLYNLKPVSINSENKIVENKL